MILVTGATGKVGREVVDLLVDTGVPLRALARDPASAKLPEGVEVVAGDYGDPDSLSNAFAGVRKLFFLFLPALGDPTGVLQVARSAGVKHIVLLSSSAVEYNHDNLVSRTYEGVEKSVRGLGCAWTFLRPGFFMSNALEWASSVRTERVVRAPYASATAMIDPRDIAAAGAAVLSSDGHEGKAYSLTGPELVSTEDQARAIGKALGEDVRFEAQPEEAARQEMGRGMPPQIVDALLRMYAEPGSFTQVSPTVTELTGRAPRTVQQWAEDHAEMFR